MAHSPYESTAVATGWWGEPSRWLPPLLSRREVQRRLFLDDRCRLAGVGRQKGNCAAGEHDCRTAEQGPPVPVRCRLGKRVATAAQERTGVGGGEGGEYRQAERRAHLLAGVQQARRETGFL